MIRRKVAVAAEKFDLMTFDALPVTFCE